jgi:hypothetical protein
VFSRKWVIHLMPQTDNPARWYARLIRKLRPEIYAISYYKQRLMVILIASMIVYGYFVVVCSAIWYWSILPNAIQMKWWLIFEFFILGAIGICVAIGSIDEETEAGEWQLLAPSGLRSLAMLVIATFLLLTLLSLPVYLTGGAINSPFSSTIVAMAGLAVLVSTSGSIRGAIIFVCMCLYWICMFWFIEVHIQSERGHRILHILSVLMSLGITVFLSVKGKFSIFRKGEKPSKELPQISNPAEPGQVVET